jgi:hypothetical protein
MVCPRPTRFLRGEERGARFDHLFPFSPQLFDGIVYTCCNDVHFRHCEIASIHAPSGDMTCVSAASLQRLRKILYRPRMAQHEMCFTRVKCWRERGCDASRMGRGCRHQPFRT